jgi:hypothetical protein
MEYYYSISGLFLNCLVWSLIITIVRYGFLKLIELRANQKPLKTVYKTLVGFLLVFSFLSIFISYIGLGQEFGEGLNYWSWDLEKKASDWGMECEGKWYFIF